MRRFPRLQLALVLVLGLAACGSSESFDAPTVSTNPSYRPEGTVVFSPDDVESDSYGEETNWTPGVDDVAGAEELLHAYIDDHPALGLDDFDTYHRQYVGIGPDDGQSLSVNALCESSGLDDWEDDYIVVADGGTCFWSAHVFVPAGIVSDFQVNGYA
jgi:hypothetical protein